MPNHIFRGMNITMPKLVNKVVFVNGRRTSMRMCQKEWKAFEEVCEREKISRNDLLGLIEEYKNDNLGLTYSARLFIISYFWSAATENGHAHANHSCADCCYTLRKLIGDSLTD